MWIVYKHTNKINGKSYIGITSRKPEDRWGNNGRKYRGLNDSGCFYNAIRKYGWDNFTHNILFTGLNEEEAKLKEKEMISFYNSFAPNGYNLTLGGEGTCGYIPDERFRKRRSELVTGGNNPTAHKVLYGDIIFDTIDDCANYLNVNRNKIVRWITGITVIPKIHFDNNLRFIDVEPNYKLSKNRASKGDRVLFNNVVYNSVPECAKVIGVGVSRLRDWLNGENGLKDDYSYLIDTDLSYVDRPTNLRLANYDKLHDNFHNKYAYNKR